MSYSIPNSGIVPEMGGRIRRGVGPNTMRTLSWRISDRPNVATIDSAAAPRIDWITVRWMSAPRMKPKSGAVMKPSQKFPVYSSVNQATTVPTMKKSPWAMLMTSSSPKIIDKPSAISAMISPQISPFRASSSNVSIITRHDRRVRQSLPVGSVRPSQNRSKARSRQPPVGVRHKICHGAGGHHVPIDVEFFRCETQRQPDKLRQVQDRHVQVLFQILLDFTLEAVEYGMAKRAGRDHGLRAAGFRRQNVLPGELDRDLLIVCGGMKAAAFSPPAVFDRPATETFREPFQCDIVAGVDEAISRRWPRDVASVECRYGKVGQWIDHHLAQPRHSDVFVQHPQEMADAGFAAIAQSLSRQAAVDRRCELGIVDESGMRVEKV